MCAAAGVRTGNGATRCVTTDVAVLVGFDPAKRIGRFDIPMYIPSR
jgi:hypothetical protein